MEQFRFTLISTDLGNLQIEEPIHWDDFLFILERHDIRHGVFEHYDDNRLIFNGASYRYIKELYDTYGVGYEGCELLVEWKCGTDWEQLPLLRLNFMKVRFPQGLEGCYAEIELDRDDCFSTFLNRFDTKVNLDSTTSVDGVALPTYGKLTEEITLEPQIIRKFHHWENGADNYGNNFGGLSESHTIVSGDDPSYFFVRNYDVAPNNPVLDEVASWLNTGVAVNPLPSGVFVAAENGDHAFDIRLHLSVYLGANTSVGAISPTSFDSYSVKVTFDIIRSASVIFTSTLYDSGSVSGTFPDNSTCDPPDSVIVGIEPVVYTGTHTLQEGDIVRLWIRVSHGSVNYVLGGSSATIDFCQRVELRNSLIGDTPSHFKIQLDSTYQATNVKAYYINEVFSRTVESITNDCLRVYSDYLGRQDSEPYTSDEFGCGSLLTLTNGQQIRRLTNAKPLTLSVKDVFDIVNSLHGIGFCLEDDPNRPGEKLIRVEQASYFYDQDDILTLTGIHDAVVEPFYQKFIVKFKNGFENWRCDEFTGLDEPNTPREYATKLQVTENVLEVVCKAIGSGYAIEVTRRQLNSSKDWRWDNHTFLICVTHQDGSYAVEQGGVINDSNLLFPSERYNLRISPARNALRWLPLLAQNYKDIDDTILYYTDGEGNVIASWENPSTCANESGVIAENGNLGLSNVFDTSLAFPAFLFEKISFTTPFSANQWLTVRANPHKRISVSWGENDMFSAKGFIYSLKYRPSEGQADIVLLPEYVSESCVFTFEFSLLYTDPLTASEDTYTIDFREAMYPMSLNYYQTNLGQTPIEISVTSVSMLDSFMVSEGFTVIEPGYYTIVFGGADFVGINVTYPNNGNPITGTILAEVVTQWIGTILFPLTINTWEINAQTVTINQVINSQAEFDAFMESYGFEKVGLNYIQTTDDKYGVMNITDNNAVDQDIIPDKECTQGIGHDMIEDDFEINGDGIDYMAIQDDFEIDKP